MKHWRSGIAILFGLLFIAGGVVLLVRSRQNMAVTPVASPAQIRQAQAARQTTESQPDVISGEPVRLTIPSLNIDLQVIPGVYDQQTGQWTLTTDKVQYAVMTPPPNNSSGNTFIYGHYRTGVFATLHDIQPGSEAMIATDNGKTFTYKLASIRTVSPQDSASVFEYQGAPILTLQTCTGLLFQNRQLFTFNLEKVS